MPTPQALISQLVTAGDPAALRVRCNLHPPERRRLALAIPALDEILGGGFPRGAISEVFGEPSSGKTTLAHALIAATIRIGGFAAWIDLSNSFYPRHASDRVLWVSPRDLVSALRATEHVLEAGGFHVVILDLEVSTLERSAVPASRWLRMARMAARRDAVVLVLSVTHVAGAFAALSLETCAHHRRFVGSRGPCPVFEGFASSLHLRRHKYDVPTATVDMYATVEM